MLKKELRNHFLQKRKALSVESLDKSSLNIFKLLSNNFELNNKKICTFLPIQSKNEVNTFELLTLTEKFSFELFTTKWNTETNELTIHKFKTIDDLITNKFGIPEPKSTIFNETPEEMSMVLIPLLCFDIKGNRVGYGKGVYDQFLLKFDPSKTIFIGLSLFEPIDEILDINEFDVKLNYCITPERIYHFE